MLRTGFMTAILGFALATSVAAQPSTALDAQGKVVRLDAPANVLVLEDGRMYRLTPSTVLLVDNRPVPLQSIQPGSVVVIRSGEMVTLQNGQYMAAAPVGVPAAVAPGATLKRTIYGKVTDVDKDGEVEIKTDKGSFEIQLTPDTVRYIKKGDSVVIDTTFGPPGAALK